MIKRVLSVLTIATLLVACNDKGYIEDGDVKVPNNAISFSTLNVQASRAVETTTSTLNKDGNSISVTAIQHIDKWSGGEFNTPTTIMNNVKVTYNGGSWSYSPVVYWPETSNEYISFYSYAPFNSEIGNVNKSLSVTDNGSMIFSMTRDGANPINEDVLYAIARNENYANTGNSSVSFVFNHALAKLNFAMRLSSDIETEDVKVNSVILKNFATRGTYDCVEGYLSLNYGECSIGSENRLNISDGEFTLGNNETKQFDSQYMLPQYIIDNYYDESAPTIEIEYVNVNSDGTEDIKVLSYNLAGSFTAWESGHSYTYTLNLNRSAITVDCSVNDYFDAGEADLLPSKPKGPGVIVIPEGVPVYNIEVYDEAYVDVKDQYNVAHLIEGADPNAIVKMSYIDDNGYIAWQDWTVTDGWFGENGMAYWGNEECVAIVRPNIDGSFDFVASYQDKAVGDSATVLLDYGNNVIIAIVATVIETPIPEIPEVPEFVVPEADYVLDVEVVQDNAWGATYIALDGTELNYWGAYSDSDKYVNAIQDVSVDITPEIEAALGLGDGELEEALNSGDAFIGAYNEENEFWDSYETYSSNYFFWYNENGAALSSYGGYCTIDNIGFHGGVVQLYGTCCLMPNKASIGTTYPTYIVFKSGDAEYVVQVNQHVVAIPDEVPLPEFEVVMTYEITYEGTNPGAYTTPDPIFSIENIMPDIQTVIGGEPDLFLMGYYDDYLEFAFQEWTVTDGWFGVSGATTWGGGSATFCLKPSADGTFNYCASRNDGALEGCVTIRYCNRLTAKAVDVIVTVILE